MAERISKPSHEAGKSIWDNFLDSLHGQARVLQSDSSTWRPLLMVIAAMCFLAALSAAGVFTVNRATQEWTTGLENSLTIQLKTQPGSENREEADNIQLRRVVAALKTTDGILSATSVSREEAAQLLEPWLGTESFAAALPVPQLIDVRFDPDNIPDLEKLKQKINDIAPNAIFQDHSRWSSRILAFADFLRGLAFSIMALITVTTIAITFFATRAGLAAQHEIVEVLHLIGAQDKFIARELQFELLVLGLSASLLGVGAAILTLLLAPRLSGAFSELPGAYLISSTNLYGNDLISLLLVPVIASVVIAITTRVTVLHALSKKL